MTRERAEELLAEKDMWLEAHPEGWAVVREFSLPAPLSMGVDITLVATGTTWREAVSNALDMPAF